MSMTNTKMDQIARDVDRAFAEIGEKHGVTIKRPNGYRYKADGSAFGFKTEVVAAAGVDENGLSNAEKVNFENNCDKFGIMPNAFGETFKLGRQQFTIVGIKPKAKKYPIIATDVDGGRYKLAARDLPEHLRNPDLSFRW